MPDRLFFSSNREPHENEGNVKDAEEKHRLGLRAVMTRVVEGMWKGRNGETASRKREGWMDASNDKEGGWMAFNRPRCLPGDALFLCVCVSVFSVGPGASFAHRGVFWTVACLFSGYVLRGAPVSLSLFGASGGVQSSVHACMHTSAWWQKSTGAPSLFGTCSSSPSGGCWTGSDWIDLGGSTAA